MQDESRQGDWFPERGRRLGSKLGLRKWKVCSWSRSNDYSPFRHTSPVSVVARREIVLPGFARGTDKRTIRGGHSASLPLFKLLQKTEVSYHQMQDSSPMRLPRPL